MCHLKLMFRINMGQPLIEASLDPRYHSSCSIYLTFSMSAESGKLKSAGVRVFIVLEYDPPQGASHEAMSSTQHCKYPAPHRSNLTTLDFVEKTARRSM